MSAQKGQEWQIVDLDSNFFVGVARQLTPAEEKLARKKGYTGPPLHSLLGITHVDGEDFAGVDAEYAPLVVAAPKLLACCETVMAAAIEETDRTSWHPSPEIDDDSWREDYAIEISLTIRELRALKAALALAKGGVA
jgi:hypothetical protein